jgi:hypothetical protein
MSSINPSSTLLLLLRGDRSAEGETRLRLLRNLPITMRRYRSYSGDVRDETAPILSSNFPPTSPLEESFPARTGMTASQRYPDGKSCILTSMCGMED